MREEQNYFLEGNGLSNTINQFEMEFCLQKRSISINSDPDPFLFHLIHSKPTLHYEQLQHH